MVSSYQLGTAIKKAREAAGLTQDDLSDKAGLAYSTLAKIEQGAIKNPSIFTVYSIAQVLATPVEALLGKEHKDPVKRRNKKQHVRFIYCDLNGVLVRFYHHAFVSLSEETGVPMDKVESTFWHYNDAANRGDISLKEFNQLMARHLGVESVDWEKHYMKEVQPITQTHDFLKKLHKRYKLGLLTNTMPGFIEKMKARGLLPDVMFDTVVDSSLVGAVKPESKIYEIAEKEAGMQGGEIFFIDDSRANLTAAERFGWRVFWFDDYDPEESIRRIEQALL
jgi:HAD superfamily hydrolase (TIGR01509 family)